jgi:hypothetical protein
LRKWGKSVKMGGVKLINPLIRKGNKMELKLDVKTLVIGIAIGVIVTAVIGAGSADKTDFGIAISSATGEGSALVRTADDGLYIVNSKSGMAIRVLQATLRAEPFDRRDMKGRPFSLSGPSQAPTKTPAGTGY